MAAYDTALNILSDTAVELGLSSISDAYGSTDAHVVQLRTLLRAVGRDLVLRHAFLQCRKEHTFQTDASSTYALPADFLAYVDGTGWNRTSQQELRPVSPQEWQALKASTDTTAWQVLFRARDTALEVWPQPPTSGDTLAFEYLSRYWVRADGSASPDKDAPTANTDVVHLDSHLVSRALKAAWLRAKGFDATAASQDFADALGAVRGVSAGASPVLSLGGKRGRPLGIPNAPLTGFGFDGQGGLG